MLAETGSQKEKEWNRGPSRDFSVIERLYRDYCFEGPSTPDELTTKAMLYV